MGKPDKVYCNTFLFFPSSTMQKPLQEKWLLYKIVTKKDAEAFGILYNTYIERIYRFVYFKIGNKEEAEDATNDIFLRTWNYLINNEQQKRVESLSGLLYGIARNTIIDIYRERAKKQMVHMEKDELEALEGENSLLHDIEIKQNTLLVEKHLRALKQEYQEVILLHYIEELSISEIAQMLNKKPLNVRVLLHRAVRKLKTLVDENKK